MINIMYNKMKTSWKNDLRIIDYAASPESCYDTTNSILKIRTKMISP